MKFLLTLCSHRSVSATRVLLPPLVDILHDSHWPQRMLLTEEDTQLPVCFLRIAGLMIWLHFAQECSALYKLYKLHTCLGSEILDIDLEHSMLGKALIKQRGLLHVAIAFLALARGNCFPGSKDTRIGRQQLYSPCTCLGQIRIFHLDCNLPEVGSSRSAESAALLADAPDTWDLSTD